MRAGAAFLIAFFFSLGLTELLRRALCAKGLRPGVREDTPERHLAKAGTPTMGGVAIIVATALGIAASRAEGSAFVPLLCAMPFALLGLVDDLWKLRWRGRTRGLKARYKLLFQAAGGLWGALLLGQTFGRDGLGWVLLTAFVFVALSNAVNLTDGLDGLAAGLSAICALALCLLSKGTAPKIFLISVAGSCLGFLWFNFHPAKIFMGDTGAMFLGAALAAGACASGLEALLPLVGAVFWAELLSVALQVCYFKLTGGRRIFRMSPLHHHFELSGWQEPQIVVRFWLTGLVAAGCAFLVKVVS